jgi:hypothetical protein
VRSLQELDVVVDAMLERIQDKRKSMRFNKDAKGKKGFFKKKDKKKKKGKEDPKKLCVHLYGFYF